MSTCHNCGHAGTFVLLVEFAIAVREDAESSAGTRPERADAPVAPRENGDCSLAVQCPACDSTDVEVAATDLLARHASSTTS